jgi:MoxR-like ATPase
MSPRATLALQRVARARAAADSRAYVVPDDLKALADPVLAHRLLVTPEAQLSGATAADVLAEVLHAVPVPAGKQK